MKKKLMVFFLIIITAECFAMDSYAENVPDELKELYAQSAVLMDADSGRILFGKNEDQIKPMASTTKIMTCILVLEHMKEKQIAEVSDYAVCQPKVRLGVRGEEQYYVEDLLYSLMLESHNDSAVVLAEAIAGTVPEFTKLMNQKADEIGCEHTHFVTPNGLDGEDERGVHATTAEDLAKIMRYCIKDSAQKEAFHKITGTKTYTFSNVKGDRTFHCNNHNSFLNMMKGAFSGKTGFTADAGYCYVGAVEQDGKTLIAALLACGWPSNKNYKWKDTKKLMEYGFEHYSYRNVWKDIETDDVLILNGQYSNNYYAKKNYSKTFIKHDEKQLLLLLKDDEKVEVKQKQIRQIHAPVSKGEQVGTVKYSVQGEVVKEYEICLSETIAKRDLYWVFQQLLKDMLL